jgi:hypothetical protein
MTDEANMSETRTDKALRAVGLLVDAVRELRLQVRILEDEVVGLRTDAAVAAAEVDEEFAAIRKLVKGNSNPRPRPGKRG